MSPPFARGASLSSELAHVGRAGSALALLAPHETAYVEFLRLRRVPLTEADADAAALSGLPDLCAEVRALAEADRDVMEKGTRAFVSWVGTFACCVPPHSAGLMSAKIPM